jgi:hypothetical protein
MLVYGVVSAETERVVEFFADRQQAEAFIADVDGNEPELAAELRIEAVDFMRSTPRGRSA